MGTVWMLSCPSLMLGYKTVYGILDAVNYGVPQFRERFVLIGSRDNEDIFLPFPTHFQMHQDPQYRWRTLQDTIKDLEYDCGVCRIQQRPPCIPPPCPRGRNWRDLPEDIRKEAMGGAYGSGGGKVGFTGGCRTASHPRHWLHPRCKRQP